MSPVVDPHPSFNPTAADMQKGLANGEFEPFFQPICGPDGSIVGAEALTRWFHPQWGVIAADKFIQLAEKTGLVQEISRRAIVKTCEYQKELSAAGHDVPISLNLSPQQLSDETLPDKIAEILRALEVLPKMIAFELTEYSALTSSETAIGILRRIREMGHDIYMDDVGDGHNNVELLSKLVEGSVLKGIKFSKDAFTAAFTGRDKKVTVMDAFRSFINQKLLSGIKIGEKTAQAAYQDESKRTELQEIIHYAKKNGLTVTLEGVEEGMIEFALEMECDRMQGFAFATALSYNDYKQKLTQEKESRKQKLSLMLHGISFKNLLPGKGGGTAAVHTAAGPAKKPSGPAK